MWVKAWRCPTQLYSTPAKAFPCHHALLRLVDHDRSPLSSHAAAGEVLAPMWSPPAMSDILLEEVRTYMGQTEFLHRRAVGHMVELVCDGEVPFRRESWWPGG